MKERKKNRKSRSKKILLSLLGRNLQRAKSVPLRARLLLVLLSGGGGGEGARRGGDGGVRREEEKAERRGVRGRGCFLFLFFFERERMSLKEKKHEKIHFFRRLCNSRALLELSRSNAPT